MLEAGIIVFEEISIEFNVFYPRETNWLSVQEVSQCRRTFMRFLYSSCVSPGIHLFSTLRGHSPFRTVSFKLNSQKTHI